MSALIASASIGQSLSSFFDAVGKFFSDLAALHWGALIVGLALLLGEPDPAHASVL